MSFILDALKKSEAERQRQSGPTLLEVRVPPPRRRYPLWALIVGALLAINVIVLLVFMLRRPTVPNAELAARATVSNAASAPTLNSAAQAPASSAPPTAATPAKAVDVVAAPAEAAASTSAESVDPDETPAVSADRSSKAERADSANYAALPNSSDLGNLPDLRLDLHVYAQRPSDRYALINMHRVHEGDVLPEGPKVIAITQEGVALDYRGQEFMLRPQ